MLYYIYIFLHSFFFFFFFGLLSFFRFYRDKWMVGYIYQLFAFLGVIFTILFLILSLGALFDFAHIYHIPWEVFSFFYQVLMLLHRFIIWRGYLIYSFRIQIIVIFIICIHVYEPSQFWLHYSLCIPDITSTITTTSRVNNDAVIWCVICRVKRLSINLITYYNYVFLSIYSVVLYLL